jgi:hypothetical protein
MVVAATKPRHRPQTKRRSHMETVRVLPHFVYALIDPRSGHPRYVGLTHNIDGRLKSHLCGGTRSNRGWIQELKDLGLEPWLVVLTDSPDWRTALCDEEVCIKQLREVYPLLNIIHGTEEAKLARAPAIGLQQCPHRDAEAEKPSGIDSIGRGALYTEVGIASYFRMSRRDVIEMVISGKWRGRRLAGDCWLISGDSIVDWSARGYAATKKS